MQNQFKKHGVAWVLAATFFLIFAGRVSAKGEAENAESILDILEKKLLEKERESLSFDKNAGAPSALDGVKIKKADKPSRIIPETSTNIESWVPGDDKLRELKKAIDGLENEVDQLSSSVVKVKGEIIEDTKLDNFSEVNVKIADKDKLEIRSLEVKLDDYPVSQVDRGVGVWLPKSQLAVFNGPLQPGKHKIDVEARVALKNGEMLPLDKNLYYSLKQTFDFDIPPEKSRNKLTVLINTPDRNLDNNKLVLQKE